MQRIVLPVGLSQF